MKMFSLTRKGAGSRGAALGLLTASAIFCCRADLTFEAGVSLGTISSDKITEGSGIAVSRLNPSIFWTHNDGPRDKIYAFRMDGVLLATWTIGKSPDDVEDIATGPGPTAGAQYLYIGDIGSNNASRDEVKIYRVQEPANDLAWAQNPLSKDFKNVDVCHLKYPDGKYDAESLLVDPRAQELYIATKQPDQSRLYKIALSKLEDGKTKNLEFVRVLPFARPSGGAVSADGALVALRREDFALAWTRNDNETVGDALARPGTQIPVIGPPAEPNGEGISFLSDGSGYVTLSEGLNQPIYFFRQTVATGGCSDAPQFTASPVRQRDGLVLSFSGCPNSTVLIEKSSDLAHWSQAGTVQLNGTNSSFLAPYETASAFYRLRKAP